MKPILTLVIALLLSSFAPIFAQGVIYKTLEEFQQKKGTKFDEYTGAFWSMGTVTSLKFEANGEKLKVKPGQIWGFTYKDRLFRICDKDNIPVALINKGTVCYYENGLAYLQMMRDNTTTGSFSVGVYCYLSLTLETDVILLPLRGVWDERDIKNILKLYPKLQPLIDCFSSKKTLTFTTGRECIEQFQGEGN